MTAPVPQARLVRLVFNNPQLVLRLNAIVTTVVPANPTG